MQLWATRSYGVFGSTCIVGALVGGHRAKSGLRRASRASVLAAALLTALLSMFGAAPTVLIFGFLLVGSMLVGAFNATVGVVAITLNVPNEIRGLALGANVFVTAVFGAATAPTAIALLSTALGGEAQIGLSIAGGCRRIRHYGLPASWMAWHWLAG